MDIRNRRALKDAARESLANASYDPRKLVLIHTLVTVTIALVITTLDFFLGDRIEDTGGLGGMGLRSILSTVQSVLRLCNLVFLPFWEVGYIHAAMNIARRKEARPDSLLEGLRHWGAILRANLLQMTLYLAVAFPCYYISMTIFVFSPLAAPLTALLEPYLNDPNAILSDPALVTAITRASVPMLFIFLGLYALLALPMVYHYRMTNYALLDDPKAGALVALRRSKLLMHGDRFALFRLDLNFWWFYGAQALLGVICYGDILLELLGVQLPFSGTVAFFLFYVLSLVLQVILFTLTRNRVAVTYAHAYEALKETVEEAPASSRPTPGNLPWKY